MNECINAEKLKTEIKKLKKGLKSLMIQLYYAANYKEWEAELNGYDKILSLIDSLQQEQPIQVNTLTWKDINDLERIINNVHYEFRNGIGEKSFGEEVLERFREERDEQEQPEIEERITITLSSFDIKLILDALERERAERLSKTPWENRNPQVYPSQYSHDYNAKPVRQVDSTLKFIKRQIEQNNAKKEESVSVVESPSKTFPRVNEFDCGNSYRR